LRIPGWTSGAELRVNGAPQRPVPVAGTYHELRRVWSAGDVVDLTLPMPAQLLQAHPLVEEARNQVAVKRGPLVYCLESPDRVEESAAAAGSGSAACPGPRPGRRRGYRRRCGR